MTNNMAQVRSGFADICSNHPRCNKYCDLNIVPRYIIRNIASAVTTPWS